MDVFRGEIYLADLGKNTGSELNGVRPVLIIQNDKGNKYSTTTIIAPLSTNIRKRCLPTHVYLDKDENNLREHSLIIVEQMKVICKSRLGKRLTKLSDRKMWAVDNAMVISIELNKQNIVYELLQELIERDDIDYDMKVSDFMDMAKHKLLIAG